MTSSQKNNLPERVYRSRHSTASSWLQFFYKYFVLDSRCYPDKKIHSAALLHARAVVISTASKGEWRFLLLLSNSCSPSPLSMPKRAIQRSIYYSTSTERNDKATVRSGSVVSLELGFFWKDPIIVVPPFPPFPQRNDGSSIFLEGMNLLFPMILLC